MGGSTPPPTTSGAEFWSKLIGTKRTREKFGSAKGPEENLAQSFKGGGGVWGVRGGGPELLKGALGGIMGNETEGRGYVYLVCHKGTFSSRGPAWAYHPRGFVQYPLQV